MNRDFIIQNLSYGFYTQPIMNFIGLLVIIIYFIRTEKSKTMFYIALIAFASVVQCIVVIYDDLPERRHRLGENTEKISFYFFLVIELTCCLSFISAYLQSAKTKKALLLANIIFVLYAVTYLFLHLTTRTYPWHIIISESLLIIAGSLCFFYELFKHQPNLNLISEPPFWAIAGMLVMYSSVVPLFLVFDYLRKSDPALTHKLYAINNTSYSLLFITFTIAILLNGRKSKNGQPHPVTSE